jgi:hypothetical protein
MMQPQSTARRRTQKTFRNANCSTTHYAYLEATHTLASQTTRDVRHSLVVVVVVPDPD